MDERLKEIEEAKRVKPLEMRRSGETWVLTTDMEARLKEIEKAKDGVE